MSAGSGLPTSVLVIVGAVVVAGLIARRVPILRVAISIVSWLLLGGLVLSLVHQREQFDPYIQRAMQMLNLQDQTVVGDTVRIRMSPDGHFWARASFNGVSRRMLIDSGATLTALSVSSARAAGLQPRAPVFPVVLNTANGMIQAQTTKVETLRLGTIRAGDLPVVVSPAFGDTDVLGMNFLSRLKSWRVEGQTLILEPHHPRPDADAT
ncbi:TIGR02281 family clan AA aspartic protease [Sphingomonas sp.]|uniref:retropepsin-like aspartic protease family protein n=1 Tax=Sphingomonas sp. TaxID=28214 RepID=UPI0028973483|nr:TIGR02281 family clan AA aspartic protease [Sphingomonas sp.]